MIKVAREAQDALEARNIPLQVAVMGCVVNGPGEARDADLGIAAGRGKGHLFVRGQVVRVVPEAEMVDALVAEAEAIVAEGIEARLAAADENAEAIAAATRDELLQIQGYDANHSDERAARIHEIAGVATGGSHADAAGALGPDRRRRVVGVDGRVGPAARAPRARHHAGRVERRADRRRRRGDAQLLPQLPPERRACTRTSSCTRSVVRSSSASATAAGRRATTGTRSAR